MVRAGLELSMMLFSTFL